MCGQKLSDHAAKRMQQRGRRPTEIEFVLQHGTLTDEGVILTRHDAAEIEREARQMLHLAGRLKNVFLPMTGGTIKTVFRATRSQQSRLLWMRTRLVNGPSP